MVYTKQGCHLCENVIASLTRLRTTRDFKLSTEDITKDFALYERFKNVIPAVEVDGKVRLAGAALSDPKTVDFVLRKTLFSA